MPVLPTSLQKTVPPMSRVEDGPSSLTLASSKHTHKFQIPKLRLHLQDLSHDGSAMFLSNVKGNEDLERLVQTTLNLLYNPDSIRPGTRSITVILRDMDGVAYTTGTDLDDDHKELHFSLGYIRQIKSEPRHELLGVLCHELVHCFQWNAEGTCNGGLIEGIADYVRLNAGLAAKHWKQEADGRWDGGYQHTGYFLQYLEERFGSGTVKRLNESLRKGKYDEEKLFAHCCGGQTVDELWKAYGEDLAKKTKQGEEPTRTEVAKTLPTDTPPR